MAAIDYARVALVLRRCAEIAADSAPTSPITRSYNDVLRASTEAYLAAHDAAASIERGFERENSAIVSAMAALEPSYCAARSIVKQHFPDAGLPDSLTGLSSLFEQAIAAETLLNILDDSVIDETWAAREIMGPFGVSAPRVLRELGEAAFASAQLGEASEVRASTYAPAFERHLVFKRVVRQVLGPQSGQYQSIHWRVAWGKEGAGPVSWGPFSFRAPFRTW